MRARVRVSGWIVPRMPSRPGWVTSMLSEASRCSSDARSSVSLRAAIAAEIFSFAALTSAPRALRPSGDSLPSAFSSAVTAPFLPSNATRCDSSASSVSAAAIAPSASSVRCPNVSIATPCTKKKRGEGSGPLPARLHHNVRRERRNASSSQAGLGLLGDRAKRRDVVHGEIRQHLAVDGDAGFVEARDQAAVGQSELARGRVDAHDPQRAELALLLLAADVGVLLGLGDGLLGNAIDLAAGVVVALGGLPGFLVTRTRGDATLDSCHGRLSLRVRQHARDTLGVGLMHVVGGAQAAFALGGLLGQDVRLEGVTGLELAGRGLAEPLGSGPVGLDLWHVCHSVWFFVTGPGDDLAIALSIHALAGLYCDDHFRAVALTVRRSTAGGLPHSFFLGLIIIVIWRPSMRGNWSTPRFRRCRPGCAGPVRSPVPGATFRARGSGCSP